MKKKAFTLIELVAVLVIMAIIALIVTPLVMSIIRKARISADKRSIDAYGRSIELAIATYLLDEGKFPTSIDELTIEYSGDRVVCETSQLNSDSSVYLAGCTVAGRDVDYTYGKEETAPAPTYTAYSVGDHVSYNGITYYVIEDSDTTNDTVKLLKENLLTFKEMGISDEENYGYTEFGGSIDYSQSTVKQKVDFWKNNAVKSGDNATARLITHEELITNLGYENRVGTINPSTNGETPSWVYNCEKDYWTMSQFGDASSKVWRVNVLDNGIIMEDTVSGYDFVRPVLELNKSADITKLD